MAMRFSGGARVGLMLVLAAGLPAVPAAAGEGIDVERIRAEIERRGLDWTAGDDGGPPTDQGSGDAGQPESDGQGDDDPGAPAGGGASGCGSAAGGGWGCWWLLAAAGLWSARHRRVGHGTAIAGRGLFRP